MDFTARQIEIMEAATERIDQFGIQNLTIKNLAADIGLSEPALYRHFSGKNEILLNLLCYFQSEMTARLSAVSSQPSDSAGERLKAMFCSQLQAFTQKPSIVSVIFAESIFRFDHVLSQKVAEMMQMMTMYVNQSVRAGQTSGEFRSDISATAISTIIMGSLQLTIMKWKRTGNQTDLVHDGNQILCEILKMIHKP